MAHELRIVHAKRMVYAGPGRGTEIVAEEILTETIMGTETVFELPVTREESGPIESDKPDLIAGETSELFQTNKGMSLREIKIIRKGLELIND